MIGPRWRSYSAGIEPAKVESRDAIDVSSCHDGFRFALPILRIMPTSHRAVGLGLAQRNPSSSTRQVGWRIVRSVAQRLHALPERLAARLADFVEIGGLAPDVPRIGMQPARLRQ